MEGSGLIHRDHEHSIPPKVTYSLTNMGRDIDAVLRSLEPAIEHWTAHTTSS
jgi:DNA-binding HxlR family transcriptional regulator